VIDAVLGLITDQDESVRRAAVEILNTTKDERAVQHLIEATADPDWWVRERAADALGEIGDLRAVPAARQDALGGPALGPRRHAGTGQAGRQGRGAAPEAAARDRDKQVKIAAMSALAEIADPASADTLIKRIARESSSQDPSIAEAATTAVQRLGERMGTGTGTGTLAGGGAGAGGEPMLATARTGANCSRPPPSLRRRWTSPSWNPATPSRAATSTSRKSAKAPSAPCCWSRTSWSTSGWC
jgi:eukaryotic-like serine/threonine-protein kinase